MPLKVLVIGYGSIGKRHTKNLISLGINPYVLTSHPDNTDGIIFLQKLDEKMHFSHTIIATPTYLHYDNMVIVVENQGCKNFLIEKPIEIDENQAKKIEFLADKHNLSVKVAYNMRFLKILQFIKDKIKEMKNFRIVKIFAGQYLPDWRKDTDYRNSYSSSKEKGGGVDLDLSHELDYMIWLFGYPQEIIYKWSSKISSLEINSPDIFKALYRYPSFIVDVELDYIRKLDRGIQIIGENELLLDVNFISKKLEFERKTFQNEELFNFSNSYICELEEFLGKVKTNKLTNLKEAILIFNLI